MTSGISKLECNFKVDGIMKIGHFFKQILE